METKKYAIDFRWMDSDGYWHANYHTTDDSPVGWLLSFVCSMGLDVQNLCFKFSVMVNP